MQIEICFSPSLIQLYEHRDSVVVVTDVFRATTTICTAFANGASYIIPVATEQEALAYKSLGHLVGAEQATERCSFADFGNSPSEYSVDKVNGKSIVFMTTNGTKAIKGAADCYQLLIGAFVNLRALTERILSLGKDVLIVCSGANGRICLEDSLFAGALTTARCSPKMVWRLPAMAHAWPSPSGIRRTATSRTSCSRASMPAASSSMASAPTSTTASVAASSVSFPNSRATNSSSAKNKKTMAQLGQYNTLKVAKIVDFGLYLDGGEGVEILMPKRYMPQDVKVDDELKVFVYQDAEARLIATNEHPYATVGQFAYLKINSVNAVGAFADWGTSKELLIPHREQAQKMEEGRRYIIYIYIDQLSGRIVVS